MNVIEKLIVRKEVEAMLKKISWRTTTWGVLGILATVAGAVYQFHLTGHFDFDGTMKAVGVIAAAAGLLPAADHKNLQQ